MHRRLHPYISPLIELGLVLALGFEVLRSVVDLTPLARHFFGFQGGPPRFAMTDPLYPALRGILSIGLLTYVIRVVTRWPGRAAHPADIDRGGGPVAIAGRDWLLTLVVWCLVVLSTVTPAARDMFDRAMVDQAPGNAELFRSRTHDGGVLQTELAMEAFFAGRNPYAIDYGDTVMARARDSDPAGWRRLGFERNPALSHVPYLPAMFILPYGFWRFTESIWGWYDQRLFYLVAAFLFVWFSGRLVEPGRGRRMVWLATGLSPLVLPFIRIGRNDIVLLCALAAFALALRHGRAILAGALLGLACATKQFAWALLPFFLIWMIRGSGCPRGRQAWVAAAFLSILTAFCLPSLLASPGAFVEDVLMFSLGMTEDAYPLRPDSLGIASLVLGAGWAHSLRSDFPLWIFQLAVTLPLAVTLGWRLVRRPTPSGLFVAASATVFSGLFFSSFFDFSYLATPFYLLMFAFLEGPSWPGGPVQVAVPAGDE